MFWVNYFCDQWLQQLSIFMPAISSSYFQCAFVLLANWLCIGKYLVCIYVYLVLMYSHKNAL